MSCNDFDVAIIGGGIVGCAVIFELTRQGYKCIMMEKNSNILSEASSGNSGMLHTGFDAPLKSLELDCIISTQRSVFQIMDKFNTPYKKCGTVLVAWTSKDVRPKIHKMGINHRDLICAKTDALLHLHDFLYAGNTVYPEMKLSQIKDKASIIGVDSAILTSTDLHKKEPFLKRTEHGALFVPGETVVDANLLGISYAHHAVREGSEILTNCEVKGFHDNMLDTSRGKMSAHVAINCAGLYGDIVDDFVGSNFFSIKPRKGQFCIFNKSSNPFVNSIIFPVPTEKSKGVALYKTVYGNIVCGPTAQDVPERTLPPFDSKTHKFLSSHALSLVPNLRDLGVIGHYTGVRPATQFKDFQIKACPSKSWISVGGIRSTGVSASLGIASLVKEKLVEEIGLDASRGSMAGVDEIEWEYQKDSCSFFMDGLTYKAAHPICHFGLQQPASKL